jgi:uncharacterized membrane protein
LGGLVAGAHTQSHSHGRGPQTSPKMRRVLLLVLAPFVLATVVGLIALWPSEAPRGLTSEFDSPNRIPATVTSVTETGCKQAPEQGPGQPAASCSSVKVRLDSGPEAGRTVSFAASGTTQSRDFAEGDKVFVGQSPNDANPNNYFFLDYQRGAPLLWLGVLFAIVVVLLSRLRGVAALAGLGLSILVLMQFILPAILEGQSPVLVAVVGSAAIMFAALYLAHGFNARTTTAVLGTMVSLLLTCLLAVVFLDLVSFTGFASEEAVFLQVTAGQVNIQGLVLAGIIIGTLGVLDDVTVTQASAIWELNVANPDYGPVKLYRSGLRIGRDHIASTVNTLVLAYAGASLPLLILFTVSNADLGETLTSEVVATEIVRTLVGSIGLVASVPITTGLAAIVVRQQLSSATPSGPKDEFRRPRAEQSFRQED